MGDLRAMTAGREGREAYAATLMPAFLHGRVVAAGTGALEIRVEPIENPAGGITFRSQLSVTGAPRRPLRAPPDARAAALRALEEPRTLSVVVALGAPRARCGEVAAAAMEAWHAAVGSTVKYDTAIAAAGDTGAALRQASLQAKAIPGGAAWKKCRDALPTCRGFEARSAAGHGMSLCVTLFGNAAEFAPELGLWIDLAGVDAARVAQLLDAARAIVDTAMRDGDGLQAFVARWAYAPNFAGSGANAYEQASGLRIDHRQTAWCTRWLRGVSTDGTWLGPALRARLGADAPAHFVGGDLDALERTLAPLLPGPDAER
jgi:hypothetical protein